MQSVRIVPLLTISLVFAACAGRVAVPPWPVLEPQIEAGQVGSASAPGSITDERTLLHTTLAHAHPRSPLFDPRLASQYLHRLTELHPESSNAVLAGYLSPLLEELEDRDQSEAERQAEHEQALEQVEELSEKVAHLETSLAEASRETTSYRQMVQRLEDDVRTREQRIGELETTLQRLRSVDLRSQE
jgi:peptidoglycan hydrolase CwlO-like protein